MDQTTGRMVLAAAMPDGGKSGASRESVEQAVRHVLGGGSIYRAAMDAKVSRDTVRTWVGEVKRRLRAAKRAQEAAA